MRARDSARVRLPRISRNYSIECGGCMNAKDADEERENEVNESEKLQKRS